MDIVDNLLSDHGHLTILARRIQKQLPHFVRARAQAAQRLRALVPVYAAYERQVHQPRKNCLRIYLAATLPNHPEQDNTRVDHQGWHSLGKRLAQPLDEVARMDLRHSLVSLLRGSRQQMQREEQGLLVSARRHLSRIERHALAMRSVGPLHLSDCQDEVARSVMVALKS